MSAEADAPVWPWPSSAQIELVLGAYVKACGLMVDVVKDREAKVEKDGKLLYKYPYADLSSGMEMARPNLAAHGLSVSQPPTMDGRDVVVTTMVLHESGQWISFPPLAMPAGNTAQNTGSAITYARRYSLLPALGVATEDDDGVNAGTRNQTPAREPEPTFSKEALDLHRELDGYRNTPTGEALKALAIKHTRRMDPVDLEDSVWRQEILNTIDAAKADADMIAGGEKP